MVKSVLLALLALALLAPAQARGGTVSVEAGVLRFRAAPADVDWITLSLDGVASDGAAGEGDTVGADVEGAFGGFAADLLVGNVADGFLVGFEGADRLLDNGGNDLLDAGAGEDQLDSTDASADDVVGS